MNKSNLIRGLSLVVATGLLSLPFTGERSIASSPAPTTSVSDARAVELLRSVERAVGADKLAQLRDVKYTYTVILHPKGDATDVSVEQYLFAGERSLGTFSRRGAFIPAEPAGTLVQGFDGATAWATLDGKVLSDAASLQASRDLRKTNYYWFAMFTKLLDGGTRHQMLSPQKVGDIEYQRVEMTFDANVGDVSDKYVLYINPTTNRVDQFLFTALSFGIVDPMLMTVTYKDVDGFAVPAERRFAPADWEGVKKMDGWLATELSTDIKFNNGFDEHAFSSGK
jgi:hypothetical protein